MNVFLLMTLEILISIFYVHLVSMCLSGTLCSSYIDIYQVMSIRSSIRICFDVLLFNQFVLTIGNSVEIVLLSHHRKTEHSNVTFCFVECENRVRTRTWQIPLPIKHTLKIVYF